jgi:hypothetical protein
MLTDVPRHCCRQESLCDTFGGEEQFKDRGAATELLAMPTKAMEPLAASYPRRAGAR